MVLSHVTKIAPPLDRGHVVWQAGHGVHGSRHCLDRDFPRACELTISTPASTSKKKVKYAESLDSVTSSRYHDKLRLINGEDPYETPKKDWNFDPNSLPAIAYPDIVNYCVYSQSAYTLNDLKGFKSLDPYNQFIRVWVSDVCSREVYGHIVVTARVSVKFNQVEPPSGLRLWPVVPELLSTNLRWLIESSAC